MLSSVLKKGREVVCEHAESCERSQTESPERAQPCIVSIAQPLTSVTGSIVECLMKWFWHPFTLAESKSGGFLLWAQMYNSAQ